MKLINAFFLLSLIAILCPCSECDELTDFHRIVVIGDIHGDSDNFRKILRTSSLIHEEINEKGETNVIWSPLKDIEGFPIRTSLIQIGDLIDRGENDMQCLNMAFSLYEQASASANDDKVVLIIGNHELLNLEGLYYMVNTNNFGGFFTKILRDYAFKPNGPYGKNIIKNFKALHVEEDSIFVHGGFSSTSQHDPLSENELNSLVQKSLLERNYDIPIFGDKGPFWDRTMIYDAMNGNCDTVDLVLKNYNVKRIIVGHTIQASGSIGVLCGGKLLAVDVGISSWILNNPVALEIFILRYKGNNGNYVITELWEVTENFQRKLDIIEQN
ncbi:unnamed protein product [Phytomonas sp. Hart1]|nr:unnamed protein product [Phytomonas sp. Hart1]|eukprot:CCW66336.1 unnamed protein product [Phytomonas sp. isolate Hart1]